MHRKHARYARASNSLAIGTPCGMKCASHVAQRRRGVHRKATRCAYTFRIPERNTTLHRKRTVCTERRHGVHADFTV